jgi:hypothetical protein
MRIVRKAFLEIEPEEGKKHRSSRGRIGQKDIEALE